MATNTTIQSKAHLLPEPLTQGLKSLMSTVSDLLPPDIPLDQFRAATWLHLTSMSGLIDSTTDSIINGLVKCATYGMLPGRDAYLIPFTNRRTKRKEATFVPDYRGLIRSLERTGKVKRAFAHPVYSRDHFVCDYLADRYEHQPKFDGDPGSLKGFYGCVVLKDGTRHVHVMSVMDIDRVKSRAPAHEDGPWVTDYVEMGRKTALKNLCKYVQLTPQVTQLMEDEEAREASDYNPARGERAVVELFGDTMVSAVAVAHPATLQAPRGAASPMPTETAPRPPDAWRDTLHTLMEQHNFAESKRLLYLAALEDPRVSTMVGEELLTGAREILAGHAEEE